MESFGRILRSRYFWLLFAAGVVFLYFFGLTIPLLGPDEPRYAQVAREMFQRGDWVTTQLGGHNWFEKPALLYWLQISSFHLFGTNEFAARFGSAVFGLGTIFSLYIFGMLASENEQAEPFEYYLPMIAATSLGLIVFSRGASFDIILTFPITAALVGYFAFDRSGEDSYRRSIGLIVFYFFVGVAILAKGLVGIVFPFAIVSFYLLLSLRWPSRSLLLSLLWGLPVTVAVAATWYLPMYLANGAEFIDEFFIQHHFQRYTSNKYLHPQPFHFFFWVLPLMTIPWLPFFFAEVWRLLKHGVEQWRKRPSGNDKGETKNPAIVFAAAWLLVPLVFFSFSGSKLPGYILPAVPAAVILAGYAVYRYALCSFRREIIVKSIAVSTLVVVGGIIQFALPGFADVDSVKRLISEADARGYQEAKVIGFTTVSHNAEWYAAGRLYRDSDGKQMRLNGPADIPPLLAANGGKPILVLSRPDLLHHIENETKLKTERIADNGEFVIAAVSLGR